MKWIALWILFVFVVSMPIRWRILRLTHQANKEHGDGSVKAEEVKQSAYASYVFQSLVYGTVLTAAVYAAFAFGLVGASGA